MESLHRFREPAKHAPQKLEPLIIAQFREVAHAEGIEIFTFLASAGQERDALFFVRIDHVFCPVSVRLSRKALTSDR